MASNSRIVSAFKTAFCQIPIVEKANVEGQGHDITTLKVIWSQHATSEDRKIKFATLHTFDSQRREFLCDSRPIRLQNEENLQSNSRGKIRAEIVKVKMGEKEKDVLNVFDGNRVTKVMSNPVFTLYIE